MLVINRPEIKNIETGKRIKSIFEMNGKQNVLWFEVEKEFEMYLTDERADAFVIGLLPMAMRYGYDMKVNSALSKRLYYTLNKHFIPVLASTLKCKPISIHCELLDDKPIKSYGAVGTGLSCGVDTFSTVFEHTDLVCPEGYKITHFTFFNVGSHGSHGGEKAQKLFEKRLKLVKQCANDLGKKVVILNSNISDILQVGFPETHTLRSMSAVLTLQKLFTVYYYSSAIHIKDFRVNPNSMGYYDVFNLSVLSTEGLSLFSSNPALTRVEKTRLIANNQLVQRYLNVCVHDDFNCGKCFKCLRTLFTLELLGKLDDFKELFDLNNYYKARSRFLVEVLATYKQDIFMREIYDEMEKTNFKIPLYVKILSALKLLKTKIGAFKVIRAIRS